MVELGNIESAPIRKKYQAYPKYKDSGVEWLGEIPEHWQIMPLKRLCVRSALYGANEPADSYVDKGVRFLRTTDISDRGDLIGAGVYLSVEAVSDYLLQTGDLLFSRSGTIPDGRSCMIKKSMGLARLLAISCALCQGPNFCLYLVFILQKVCISNTGRRPL